MRERNRSGRYWLPIISALAVALVKPPPNDAYSRGHEARRVAPPHAVALPSQNRWDPLAQLAQDDPLALLAAAQERCGREIQDYCCILERQEQRDKRLGDVERIEMRYRSRPQSVYLSWLQNPGRARKAVYVRGRDRDDRGRELAVVEPAGCVLRFFASKVRIPVRGKEARAASRQTLDKAGFRGTFASLDRVHGRATARGELELTYAGEGEIDGRLTYVLVRELPYTGEECVYPNAKLILHLDQQWLLPVGIYSYADRDATAILGSYTMTDVEINVGLDDQAFEF